MSENDGIEDVLEDVKIPPDDGGWVYPQNDYSNTSTLEGVTLRNHLAGLAMQALIPAFVLRINKNDDFDWDVFNFDQTENIAQNAYEMADAMIREGKK